MKLTNQQFSHLSQLATSAARQAGQLIASYQNKQVTVNTKSGGHSLASQVVTEVDLLSQEIILKTLLPTCTEFDLALLTEESTDDHSRFAKDYFWCIDPLDGTLPFINQTPGYAVSIALVSRNGESCIGVIFDPLEQTLYHAVKGQGAFRNERPWTPRHEAKNGDEILKLITDRSFSTSRFSKEIELELELIATKTGKRLHIREQGGAAMNACWVLESPPACYFKFPKPQNGGGSLWDYAASACIYNEAGMVVSDIFGNPLDLNRADSSYMNHRGVIFASNPTLAKQIRDMHLKLTS